MFRCVVAIVLAFAVDAVLQPDEWAKIVAERRKKHLPSPQQLAKTFSEADVAKKNAKKEHKAFLKSPEHHAQMIHHGNEIAEKARRRSADEDDLNTKHCGMTMSLANAGYANTENTRRIFLLADSYKAPQSFLQSNPGMAQPGSGSAQVTKDEGRSVGGTVSEAEKGKIVEPYVKVFKDGYSFAMCAYDAMYDFGDKYGSNKDQYNEQHMNVSIVHYSQILLKEKQKGMSPKICFEFCRTVPNMVYFGIRSGRDCYCMPFYKKAANELSGSESCDYPCPGDPTQMCGGKTKSQLFEMHMCADTAGDLLYSAVNAEQELVYMYDTIFMTDKIAVWLDKVGHELQTVAGAGGDPGAADLAQLAINEAVSLFDDSTGWGVCKRQYVMLLDLYRDAKPLWKADFTKAKLIQKAEDTIAMMDSLKSKLHWCAKRSEGPILNTFPFYFEFMAALDETFLQKKMDKFADSLVMYYPALYFINPMADPEMSVCTGKPVKKPMVTTLAGCAEACNREVTPPHRCTAFQFFQLMDGDNQKPLCFLFKEIESIRSYRCGSLPTLTQTDVATTNTRATQGKSLLSQEKTNSSKISMELCDKVKQAKRFSGMSCQAIFGLRSKIIEACPDECDDNQGMKQTAVCMTRLSASAPKVEVTEGARGRRKCFGSGNGPHDQSKADFRLVEFGQDASGGAGPKIEGDLHMDGTVIKEPYGFVWTPGPAGAR